MNPLRYTNGTGHLILSIVLIGVGLTLCILGHIVEGMAIIMLVGSAYYAPGAAKAAVHEVQKTVTAPLPDDSGDKTE